MKKTGNPEGKMEKWRMCKNEKKENKETRKSQAVWTILKSQKINKKGGNKVNKEWRGEGEFTQDNLG